MKAVACTDLHAAYDARRLGSGAEVLHGITFAAEEGSRVAILGANGSGKSTLLKALTGMVPFRGDVQLLGRPMQKMARREIAASAALLSQLSELFFSYTVAETVLMGRYIHLRGGYRGYTERDHEIAEECMRRTGVLALAKRQLSQLSGGELQRVFLARTFAQDAPILLLDEPTNHLDLKVVAGMSDYLLEWSAQEHHTLIGVYHDIPLALQLSDHLILLKEGKITAQGLKEEVLDSGALEEAYDFEVRGYLRRMSLCEGASKPCGI